MTPYAAIEDIESERLARMARAIAFLTRNRASRPDLETAARAVGLSPSHFRREFARAAGISPKAYLAALAWEDAREKLRRGGSLIETALAAGLSGPSRLHDLALKVEAMTPGAYARGGAGLAIAYGFHPSLFGTALLMATERGLCGLAFADAGGEEAVLSDMRQHWPKANLVHDQTAIASYAQRIFAAAPGNGEAIPVQLFGTPWQIKVWQALLAIPEGRLATYGAVGAAVGAPHAARAAGAAVGRNPVALLIPCHRVLAASGALAGYRWGADRKRALIAYEAARTAEG